MSAVVLGVGEILAIISHVKKWVTNLIRANKERKEQSIDALRAVVQAARKTKIYSPYLHKEDNKSIDKKAELSALWTDLSFALVDIGLIKLSKSCNNLGSYWADPAAFEENFIETLGNRLQDIEERARKSLKEITK